MSKFEKNSKDKQFSQICGDSFGKSLNKSKESFNGMSQYPEIDITKKFFVKGTPVKGTSCNGTTSPSIPNNKK